MLPSLNQLLRDGATALRAHGIEDAQLEAEILLAHSLGVSRSYLFTWPDNSPSDVQSAKFADCLSRRCLHEPIAYITGKREFWSIQLEVSTATLIPRPETELLVETALTHGDSLSGSVKLADLGTGSGAIALALAQERAGWEVTGVDISAEALVVAKRNADQLQLNNVTFYQGDWCDALQAGDYDMIISNPPYISEAEWPIYANGLRYEPRSALVSGGDGLDAIREISRAAGHYLKNNGILLIEHGFRQASSVQSIFAAEGYDNVHSLVDLSGNERVTVGTYKGNAYKT